MIIYKWFETRDFKQYAQEKPDAYRLAMCEEKIWIQFMRHLSRALRDS